jgi:hypothetical protein
MRVRYAVERRDVVVREHLLDVPPAVAGELPTQLHLPIHAEGFTCPIEADPGVKGCALRYTRTPIQIKFRRVDQPD